MKKLRVILGASCVGLLSAAVPISASVLSSTPAGADPVAAPVCPGGDHIAISGTYHRLTITGNDYVATGATLNVKGSLTIAPGACLDAFSVSTVHVGGSITVEKGAVLGLGCSPGAQGPVPPCNTATTTDTVGGSIVAYRPLTMYLTADSIGGSVVSNGGGPGLGKPPATPYTNFPIKENHIGGNLIVQGWKGAWAGLLRNTVGGDVVFNRNKSAIDPDANEVVTNTIGGNLICFGNSPAVQVGDSGGSPNTVGGYKVGQCNAPGL